MKTVAAFISFASLACAMCHYGTTLAPRGTIVARAKSKYGYNGLDGPLNWHGLSPKNERCALGTNQSPVNIVSGSYSTIHGSSFNLEVPDYPDGAEFENLGTNVQVFVNGSAAVGGKDYAVQQFHFHTPSEHRIDSVYYPMEVHFVMQADDESLAVIGLMIEVATDSETPSDAMSASLANVDEIPAAGDVTTTAPLDFSRLQRHISKSDVFSYAGSLTTPPCDEGVDFNVVAEPVFVDVATFRAVKGVLKFNSRYTQNVPGQINLLDNARDVLDSEGHDDH